MERKEKEKDKKTKGLSYGGRRREEEMEECCCFSPFQLKQSQELPPGNRGRKA